MYVCAYKPGLLQHDRCIVKK